MTGSGGAAIETMHCNQLVEVATGYLEGTLEPAARTALEDHLAICPACVEYIGQIKVGIDVAARLGEDPEPVSDEVRAELLTLFRVELGCED